MKNLGSVLTLTVALAACAFPNFASAKTCTVDIFKTYTPRGPGKAACDSKDLPADFAGNLTDLISGLKTRGYVAKTYDQCAQGMNDPATYALISQLGSCLQSGISGQCQLYVALYRNEDSKALYENTIQQDGIGSVTLQLSDALQGLPDCSAL